MSKTKINLFKIFKKLILSKYLFLAVLFFTLGYLAHGDLSIAKFLHSQNFQKLTFCPPPELLSSSSKFPALDIPMKYLDYSYLIRWSECDDKTNQDPSCYKKVKDGNFDGPYAYQSYPSTQITIKNYINYEKQEPPSLDGAIKQAASLRIESTDVGDVASDAIIIEAYKKYGVAAGNFILQNSPQSNIRADVTNDGVPESIVFTCPRNYAGSSCGTYWISDDQGNLLFSDYDVAIQLEPSGDGNGFFLSNKHPDDDEAFCCERIRNRAKFVYEDDKFIPVFEQVVAELKIDSTISELESEVTKKEDPFFYAVLTKVSTSGEARFVKYDFTNEPSNQNNDDWFWAMPYDVPDDQKITDKWVSFLQAHPLSIFKITGSYRDSDCAYADSRCVDSFNITEIEAWESEDKIVY